MTADVEKVQEPVQEPEYAARDGGYSFVSHPQEVGTAYFDEVTAVIQGGTSSDRADRFDRRAFPLSDQAIPQARAADTTENRVSQSYFTRRCGLLTP